MRPCPASASMALKMVNRLLLVAMPQHLIVEGKIVEGNALQAIV